MYTTSSSGWPSTISDVQPRSSSVATQSRSPPLSQSALNGVKQDSLVKPKSPEKVSSSIVVSPPSGSTTSTSATGASGHVSLSLPSPPASGTPSPSSSDLSLDLFAAASKRLPIFATLTLSPKKNQPIKA
eukprot:TRINITY_DN3191_c0_g1_i17.p1 TRINITY_DN3191_c0_g1~~TRINITY_DN3191_c0_g1_i17.p1  ORF type:complete len:130 (-),score=8.40 TRINITY_DN3191_c0_g1_i17:267-656(-)